MLFYLTTERRTSQHSVLLTGLPERLANVLGIFADVYQDLDRLQGAVVGLVFKSYSERPFGLRNARFRSWKL